MVLLGRLGVGLEGVAARFGMVVRGSAVGWREVGQGGAGRGSMDRYGGRGQWGLWGGVREVW